MKCKSQPQVVKYDNYPQLIRRNEGEKQEEKTPLEIPEQALNRQKKKTIHTRHAYVWTNTHTYGMYIQYKNKFQIEKKKEKIVCVRLKIL